jgi:hypothetical protein
LLVAAIVIRSIDAGPAMCEVVGAIPGVRSGNRTGGVPACHGHGAAGDEFLFLTAASASAARRSSSGGIGATRFFGGFRFSAVTGVVTFASAGRCLSAAALVSSGPRVLGDFNFCGAARRFGFSAVTGVVIGFRFCRAMSVRGGSTRRPGSPGSWYRSPPNGTNSTPTYRRQGNCCCQSDDRSKELDARPARPVLVQRG